MKFRINVGIWDSEERLANAMLWFFGSNMIAWFVVAVYASEKGNYILAIVSGLYALANLVLSLSANKRGRMLTESRRAEMWEFGRD